MKKLDRLILRSFIGPLLLTFSVAIFVLLMQFVWKYIDDLVGKGLEFKVIVELLLYASATFVPMALPIAVLFASIMTMGNFGERYELVAMKAGGVSISRVMAPMAMVVLLLTGVAFYFANNVMPTAMLRYRMTLYDITRKKPAVNIRPGEYYKDIDNYVIRVGSKDSDDGTLTDIIIYDHSHGTNESSVIVAESGRMYSTPDNQYLRFTLYNGYSYLENADGENRTKRPLTTIGFDEQTISFDISSFAFNRSAEGLFSGSYQMMNVVQLDTTVRHLRSTLTERQNHFNQEVTSSLHAWRHFTATEEPASISLNPVDMQPVATPNFTKGQELRSIDFAISSARTAAAEIKTARDVQRSDREYINRHIIEWQRKYTLSIACLLLFFVGAPFGSIVRKGGLGLPLVASVLFFVLYYVVGMIAEKAVRESAMGAIGMWVSTFTMIPIGLLLTVQATTDSSLFEPATWRRLFQRLFLHFRHR